MGSLCFGQELVDNTCIGTTLSGTNCKIKVDKDSTNYCHYHINGNVFNGEKVESVVCGENTKKNTPCKLKLSTRVVNVITTVTKK